MSAVTVSRTAPASSASFSQKLNTVWHKRALNLFMLVVLAHWAEHLTQAYQIYVLGWPRPRAGGVMGFFFPWLVSSEVLHYGYALVIQFWHHIEHAVLQWQALTHHYWFGSPVPTSFLQLLFPKFRVEIHLFYNAVVFIPMMIGMYYHMFPPKGEPVAACSCAVRHEPLPAVAG